MISLVLINVLLNNRDAVVAALTDKTWEELEKKELGTKVQMYLEGSINSGRMLRAIRTAYGKNSESYKSLYETYMSMRNSTMKYARLTITIPPSVDAILELFKLEGGKKSQFASACMDNIISKLNKDPQLMLKYVHEWLVTEKIIDPNIPESALAVRKQKASLDALAESRERYKKERKQREQEEMGRTRTKEEREEMLKQQRAINQITTKFKREHGRKPNREEYAKLLRSGKNGDSAVITEEKKPTTAAEIEKARKKQEAMNKKLEKEKLRKTVTHQEDFEDDEW